MKSELSKSFDMKDLGPLNFCLGIEFLEEKEKGEIKLCQRKYIKEVLRRFNMEHCKPVSTPMNISEKLSKSMCPKNDEERKEVEKLPYQNLIESLMYLAVSTRPDISHAVSALSQYNTNYGMQHWVAAKRVLRYLKGTGNKGLIFRKTGKNLVGYADADWGLNVDDRKSYTGYVFHLANAAVSWESRKQKTVALSSTEAEYMALVDSAKEAIHLRRSLKEILKRKPPKTTIFNDNQSAGLFTKNPIFHNRTKQVDIRYHFTRECVETGDIEVRYLPTEEMPADVLTKALPLPKHVKCIAKLGIKTIC